MNKIYTGIGSRETPEEILNLMAWIAWELYLDGYILRSGGAPGADQAFENSIARDSKDKKNVQKHAEIYLPWESFEKENRSFIEPKLTSPTKKAYELGAKYHPRWRGLTPGAMMLHARNIHQVLGADLDNPVPSDFIVCWTEGAKGKGGTGQALRVAKDVVIPIYDLANEDSMVEMIDFILELR